MPERPAEIPLGYGTRVKCNILAEFREAEPCAPTRTAYTPGRGSMRRLLPAPNLTAILALAALADLWLYRVVNAVFLPSHEGTPLERWTATTALFCSNFASILALVLAMAAIYSALSGERVFPRSMRITVSTIGLFFCTLSGVGVLWDLTMPYQVHLRISHGFLAFFLVVGMWRSDHPWRLRVGLTLLAAPIALQALAIFVLRMGWSSPSPGDLAKLAHSMTLMGMIGSPFLFVPERWTRLRVVLAVAAGLLLAAGLGIAFNRRFDLVQAALFYGLRIDLAGLASPSERIYAVTLVAAFASIGAAIAGCLLGSPRARLAGWGLLLMATAGMEITSAKPALLTLCGLLALASSGSVPISSARIDSSPLLSSTAEAPRT